MTWLKHLLLTALFYSALPSLYACCAGPFSTLTGLLVNTSPQLDIFEIEVDSVGYTQQGEFWSRAKLLKTHNGDPLESIHILSGGNSSAGGKRLEVGKSYLIISSSQDRINYHAFVCDYFSTEIYSSNSYSRGFSNKVQNSGKLVRKVKIVRDYFQFVNNRYTGKVVLKDGDFIHAQGEMVDGVINGEWSHFLNISRGPDKGKSILISQYHYDMGVIHGLSIKRNIGPITKHEANSIYHQGKMVSSEYSTVDEYGKRIIKSRTIYFSDKDFNYTKQNHYNKKSAPTGINSNMQIASFKRHRGCPDLMQNILNGESKKYSNKGILIEEGSYELGAKVGKWNYYNEDGILEEETLYDYPSISKDSIFFYHPDGNIAVKGKLKDGKLNDIWRVYNEEGQLTYEGEYKFGLLDGKRVNFYKEEITTESNFLAGKLHGETLSIKKGKLVRRENYIHGLKQGITYHFKEDYISKIETYNKNKKHGTEASFNENGDTLSLMKYENTVLVGDYILYDHKDRKKEKGQYKNGQRIGIWKLYYPHLNYLKEIEYPPFDKEKVPSIFENSRNYKTLKIVDMGGEEIDQEETKERLREYREHKKNNSK